MANTDLTPQDLTELASLVAPHLPHDDLVAASESRKELLERETKAGRVGVYSNGVVFWNRKESHLLDEIVVWVNDPKRSGVLVFQGSELAQGVGITNPTSEDYRTVARLMAELKWASKKNSKGTMYIRQGFSPIPFVTEYPFLLTPVQLGASWLTDESDHKSMLDDLNAMAVSIPNQTQGRFAQIPWIQIHLPPEEYNRIDSTPVLPTVTESILAYFKKQWAGVGVVRNYQLSAGVQESEAGVRGKEFIPVLLKNRAIIRYIDDSGALLAHTYAEWAS